MNKNLLPTVAVIIVNFNGKKHLENCFESLRQLNYPQEKVEIICVDNNSSDGSVDYIKGNFPEVCCIETGANTGFAKGCNRGAQQAQSDYIAFLNNDARADKDWLLNSVEAVQQDEKTVCVASKILDWEGNTIDFVEGHINFYGFARQAYWRTETEPGDFQESKPLLFACGGAMLIDRQVFVDVGGFDEDYFMFFEDVDLGWRLWVLGYKVIFVPEAIVYHRHHGSADKVGRYKRQFLYERNALATIFKNYEQANLDKILPAALFLSIYRTVDHLQGANIEPNALHPDNWPNLPNDKLEQTISIGRLAPLMGAHDLIVSMPDLIEKRKRIQSKRQLADGEIFKLFGQPLRIYSIVPYSGPIYPWSHENLVKAFHIREIFEGAGKQILVLTDSGLPKFGFSATSRGLRAEAIGKELENKGYEVLYSIPANLVEKHSDLPKRFKKLVWNKSDVDDVVFDVGPDVLIVCDWPVLEFLKAGIYRPVILDYAVSDTSQANLNEISPNCKNSFANVDFFICSTEKEQRSLSMWLQQKDLAVGLDKVCVIPTASLADDSVGGSEPLHRFCQEPSVKKDKLEIQSTPLSGLFAKAWRLFRKSGVGALKKEINQYIHWHTNR